MNKSLHFRAADAIIKDGERYVTCEFMAMDDDVVRHAKSQLVRDRDWPTFRLYLQRGGWVEDKTKP